MTTPDMGTGQDLLRWLGDFPAITRFAPSPTGLLHLGHGWSAILAHDLARMSGGRFLLRVEDIDSTRCRPEYVAGISDDLLWLGLAPDGPALVQSARRDAHGSALARLGQLGLTYPCFCTRADIAAAGGAPHGPAIAYPGTCRKLDTAVASARASREPHAIRLDVARAADRAGPLFWQDALAGLVPADPLPGGDIVLGRRDIGVGYALAVVVDDAFQQVSHIVRGRDLFEATHVQRLLQALLDLPTPRYLHHPLVLGDNGKRLAKRDHAATLRSSREQGADGQALARRLRLEPITGPDRILIA